MSSILFLARSVLSVECRVSFDLRDFPRHSGHQSSQTTFKSSRHRRNYLALVELSRAQIIVNLYYLLFADVACVESAVSPKPRCCRDWFVSPVGPLNRRGSSTVRQRRRMENQRPVIRPGNLVLANLLRQQRGNSDIGNKIAA